MINIYKEFPVLKKIRIIFWLSFFFCGLIFLIIGSNKEQEYRESLRECKIIGVVEDIKRDAKHLPNIKILNKWYYLGDGPWIGKMRDCINIGDSIVKDSNSVILKLFRRKQDGQFKFVMDNN